MKTLTCFVAAAAMLIGVPGLLRGEAEPLRDEAIGKISLDLTAKDVVELLGKPNSKGKDTHWEAIGQWVQEWAFPAHGLILDMASDKKGGAKTVFKVTAIKGCKLATKRGIHLGSTESEVRKAYGKLEDKEESVRGNFFIAGSIYEGVFFTIREGKVTQIVMGAGAE